jgi:arylsulfatase A
MNGNLVLLGILFTVVTGGFAAERPSKPNILFILADDSGIEDYGCYGSDRFKGKTPNIDSLAKTGLRFERCYAEPLCGPSRATIMTGRYVFRTGAFSNQSTHTTSFKDEPSLARTLKQAGYVTGMAGKWRQVADSPGDWGFDEFVTDNTAGGWYWKDNYNKNGRTVQSDKEVYCPEVCLEFAVDFFKRHKDEPFYFYFPSHLVHGPILRTPDSKDPTADKEKLYDDNMVYLDKQVGQLVDALEKLGLREKTLIVFSGDNGTAQQSGTIGGRQINGHKGTVLEGGSRVPLIANWKGVVAGGSVVKDLVDFTDFFPTFAEVAGAKMPTDVKIDGRSFAPRLHGAAGNPREWVFVHLGARWYARNDGWKLTQTGELYDLSDAPFVEKLVMADSESDVSKTARKQLQAVLTELSPEKGKTGQPGDDGKKKKRDRKKKRAAAAEKA